MKAPSPDRPTLHLHGLWSAAEAPAKAARGILTMLGKKYKSNMKHIKNILLSLMLSGAVGLTGCKSEPPKVSSFTNLEAARADFDKLVTVADRIFWRATDRCMLDSGSGMRQIPETEFTGAHECKLVELKQVNNKGKSYFIGTVRIFNPETPTQWFQIELEEAGRGWKGVDCALIMDGHVMNYFEGRFLSATNLKPYIDESIDYFMRGAP